MKFIKSLKSTTPSSLQSILENKCLEKSFSNLFIVYSFCIDKKLNNCDGLNSSLLGEHIDMNIS